MTKKANPRTIRWYLGQMWRDLLSVYYANTPIWRWLKSAALVFLGFFAWMSGAALLSVRPTWGFLHYLMAYGFLLLVWGPFTHFVVVPLAIRLRRTGRHPLARTFSRHSGKINLTIFFTLVIVLGTVTPGIMMLEFSPIFGDRAGDDVRGDLVCDVSDDVVSCQVVDAQGIDHVVVTSGGTVVATADDPPFAFQVDTADIEESRTGKEFVVDYRNEDGESVRRLVRQVPD